jgi:hypothetical protein
MARRQILLKSAVRKSIDAVSARFQQARASADIFNQPPRARIRILPEIHEFPDKLFFSDIRGTLKAFLVAVGFKCQPVEKLPHFIAVYSQGQAVLQKFISAGRPPAQFLTLPLV